MHSHCKYLQVREFDLAPTNIESAHAHQVACGNDRQYQPQRKLFKSRGSSPLAASEFEGGMRLCRRRWSCLLLGLLAACCISVYLCFLSASMLPHEDERVPLEPGLAHQAREVIMNGQREILNINQQLPVMVASVSSSGKS